MIQRITKTKRFIGQTSKGLPVFAILGAEDDENEDDGTGDGGDGSGSGGTGSEGQGTGKEGEGAGGDAPKTYSAEEYAALEARMKAADQNASKAQADLKKIEDAKKDDLTKATERVTELEGTLSEKDQAIADLRFENAFLTDNSVVWHDPALALSQARTRPEVKIDDDGKVTGLQAAIKALAKEKPFMVKESKDENEAPPRSGSSTGSGPKATKIKDEQELRRKYAALNV